MTWNLFVTIIIVPLSVGLLGWAANKAWNSWKAGWAEAEAQKEARLEDWRQRLNQSLEQGRLTMQALADRLQGVVTVVECEESHDVIIHKLEDHHERITVLEVGAGIKGGKK